MSLPSGGAAVARYRLRRAATWCIHWVLGLFLLALLVQLALAALLAPSLPSLAVSRILEYTLIAWWIGRGLLITAPLIVLAAWLTATPRRRLSPVMPLLGGGLSAFAALITARYETSLAAPPADSGLIIQIVIGAVSGWYADWMVRRLGVPESPADDRVALWTSLKPSRYPHARLQYSTAAVVALLAAWSWWDMSRPHYLTVTFDLVYDGKPLALSTTYYCAPPDTSEIARDDARRRTTSTALPDGNAIVLSLGNPCEVSSFRRREWFDQIALGVLDDPVNPKEVAIYNNVSQARTNPDMPRLNGYHTSYGTAEDREAAKAQEVGYLWAGQLRMPTQRLNPNRPVIAFTLIRALHIPKERWSEDTALQFLETEAKPALIPVSADMQRAVAKLKTYDLAKWSTFDIPTKRVSADAEGALRGVILEPQLNDLPCLAFWKAVTALTPAGTCDGEQYYFDPSDQSVSILIRDFPIYQPVIDHSGFPTLQK